MHTKLKGDIGELQVAKELLSRGWHIAFPFEENLKYDLVAEKEGVFKRIQVKAVMPKNGALHVNCRSSNNWSVIHYNKKDFEVLAVVDIDSGKIYFIPSDQIHKSLINLRLVHAKNSQKIGINHAENYKDI